MAQGLTPGQLNAVFIEVSDRIHYTYGQIFGGPGNWAKDFTGAPIKTDQDSVTFNMLQTKIGLVEGERGVPTKRRRDLGDDHVVTVKKWEDAIELSTHDMSEDRLALFQDKINELAEGAAFLNRDQIVDSLINGATATYNGFDGVPLFDNAHPRGGTTFDNLGAGVLNKANFQANRTAMVRFPSDAGTSRPIGADPNKLIVPPDLRETALELMNNFFVPGASGEGDNILQGAAEVIVVEEFTDTNDWYLVHVADFVKPYLHIQKTGFSPFKVEPRGTIVDSEEWDREVLAWVGKTYERVYPSRPEFFFKSVN